MKIIKNAEVKWQEKLAIKYDYNPDDFYWD